MVIVSAAIYAGMELGGVGKHWSFLFMAVAMLLFVTWVLCRGGATFRSYGFRRDNLLVSWAMAAS